MPTDEPSALSIVIDSLNRLEGKTDSGFATVMAKIDGKADKTDIAKLDVRLDGVEKRVEKTEGQLRAKDIESKTQQDADTQRKERRQNRFNYLIGALSCMALVVSVLLGVIH